jgi:hypothetical protein
MGSMLIVDKNKCSMSRENIAPNIPITGALQE